MFVQLDMSQGIDPEQVHKGLIEAEATWVEIFGGSTGYVVMLNDGLFSITPGTLGMYDGEAKQHLHPTTIP